MLRSFCILAILSFYAQSLHASLGLGEPPPQIKLSGSLGGLVDGGVWDSSTLKNKVHLLVYSSPSSKEDNNAATKAVKGQNFPAEFFGSIAVVNMKASWLPDLVLAAAIESKQKEYQRTIFVKDVERTLVNMWGLKDDASNLLVFNRSGELVFNQAGTLSEADTNRLLSTIKTSIEKLK